MIYGMTFRGRHGVTEAERRVSKRFVVDVELELDLSRAAQSDELGDTVDYTHIMRLVRRCVEGPSVRLLEALGERIAQAILRDYSAVAAVVVRVFKPDPPITAEFERVGVEIRRRRG